MNILKKKKYSVTGPLSADTIFLSQNRKKYDVILGMYHYQVIFLKMVILMLSLLRHIQILF